jgi:hypothetical protein
LIWVSYRAVKSGDSAAGTARIATAVPHRSLSGDAFMSEHQDHTAASSEEPEAVPAMQRLLDNPFLLLFIGVTVPTVFYVIWGVMEIVTIPLAK